MLPAHDRQRVLARHDRAAQVDRADTSEDLLRDLGHYRIARTQAHADVVVQNVKPAPALDCGVHRRRKRRLAGDVGLEGDAFAAFFGDHRGSLGRGTRVAIDCKDSGALLREPQRRGAAIADALSRTLTRPNDNRNFAAKTHKTARLFLLGICAIIIKLAPTIQARPRMVKADLLRLS